LAAPAAGMVTWPFAVMREVFMIEPPELVSYISYNVQEVKIIKSKDYHHRGHRGKAEKGRGKDE